MTKSTMSYRFGDVLLVPFSHLGEKQTTESTVKQRPVIVISSDLQNQRRKNLIVIAATSSQLHAQQLYPDSFVVSSWAQADLPRPLFAVPVVATFPYSHNLKTIGSLLYQDKKRLQEFLDKIMGKG